VLRIFAPIQTRPSRGSYTGYGKRLPSDRPPIMTPKELALTAAADGKDLPASGNGQASTPNAHGGTPPAGLPPFSPDDPLPGEPL
jgi:cell division protease FtsH